MLLYFADYLAQFYSGFGVFQYLTLRAILGALTALLISFVVGTGSGVSSSLQLLKLMIKTVRLKIKNTFLIVFMIILYLMILLFNFCDVI